ncbi:hypothetical protein EMPS_04533 [Entomortierella parvispora]|uniref:F-box domain-containing protein n=1 Tax=Entomortierella parvispora TaxID=205924 RepID=A0A9P3LVH7_9FUNG|nr:hypothetical protein EMPS_04533 [Entomortierella parvispora]
MSGPAPTHALELPEILLRISQFLPLWSAGDRGSYIFEPQTLLACTLVSKSFRQAMLPTLWYMFDHSFMRNLPESIMFKYSPHFRILGLNYPVSVTLPTTSTSTATTTTTPLRSLSCTWLIDLRIYGNEPSCRDLLHVNPQLQKILWAGTTEYSDDSIPVVEPNLLKGLTDLRWLRLCEWDLGREGALLPMLQAVQNTLTVLRLDSFCGGEGVLPDPLPATAENSPFLAPDHGISDGSPSPWLRIKELTMDLQFTLSHQLIDLVAFCPLLEDLTLIAACDADLNRLVQNLEHCPNLSRIQVDGIYFGLFDTYRILRDSKFASLIRCCNRVPQSLSRSLSPFGENVDIEERGSSSGSGNGKSAKRGGLKSFRADVHGLEPLFTQALIEAGPSLQSLHLTIHRMQHDETDIDTDDDEDDRGIVRSRYDIKRDQLQLYRILEACPNLEKVQLEFEDPVFSNSTIFTVDPRWQSIVKVVNNGV